jgi:hypothetical protein
MADDKTPDQEQQAVLAEPAGAMLVGTLVGAAFSTLLIGAVFERSLAVAISAGSFGAFLLWVAAMVRAHVLTTRNAAVARLRIAFRSQWDNEVLQTAFAHKARVREIWNARSAREQLDISFQEVSVTHTALYLSLRLCSPMPEPHKIELKSGSITVCTHDGRREFVVGDLAPKAATFNGETFIRCMEQRPIVFQEDVKTAVVSGVPFVRVFVSCVFEVSYDNTTFSGMPVHHSACVEVKAER